MGTTHATTVGPVGAGTSPAAGFASFYGAVAGVTPTKYAGAAVDATTGQVSSAMGPTASEPRYRPEHLDDKYLSTIRGDGPLAEQFRNRYVPEVRPDMPVAQDFNYATINTAHRDMKFVDGGPVTRERGRQKGAVLTPTPYTSVLVTSDAVMEVFSERMRQLEADDPDHKRHAKVSKKLADGTLENGTILRFKGEVIRRPIARFQNAITFAEHMELLFLGIGQHKDKGYLAESTSLSDFVLNGLFVLWNANMYVPVTRSTRPADITVPESLREEVHAYFDSVAEQRGMRYNHAWNALLTELDKPNIEYSDMEDLMRDAKDLPNAGVIWKA